MSAISRAATRLTVVALLCASASHGASKRTPKAVVVMGACKAGLHAAPAGPFSVLLSCEDALGNYMSVVYSGAMESPVDGAWRISERFWYETSWGDDVTSYAWDSLGRRLYVATSGIYGTPGVHALDLGRRQSRRLVGVDLNREAETIFTIKGLDEKAGRLEVVQELDGVQTTRFVSSLTATDSLQQAKP